LEGEAPPHIDTVVEAACWWFIHAANKLWTCFEKRQEFEGRRAIGGGEYREREWKGYNPHRWAIWEQALLNAYSISENEETKKLIQAALA